MILRIVTHIFPIYHFLVGRMVKYVTGREVLPWSTCRGHITTFLICDTMKPHRVAVETGEKEFISHSFLSALLGVHHIADLFGASYGHQAIRGWPGPSADGLGPRLAPNRSNSWGSVGA